MRWTRMCLLTSGNDADGEVVWSWRPEVRRQVRDDAFLASHGRRWQTGWFTEESAYKP